MKRLWFGIFLFSFLLSCASSRVVVVPTAQESSRDLTYDYLIAQMERLEHHPQKALSLLDRVIEKNPESSHLWLQRAKLKASVGDLKGAEEDSLQALERRPEHFDTIVFTGKIYQSQAKGDQAAEFYRKALALKSDDYETNFLLIEVYVGKKEYQKAIEILQTWSKREPHNIQPLFHLAAFYESLTKEPEKAILTYNQILKIDKKNLQALSGLAQIYFDEKRTKEAMAVLKRVRNNVVGDVTAQLKIALIYYEAKQYEEAISTFQNVLKLDPGSDRVIYYLGVIFENIKKDEKALVEFAKIKPNSNFYKDSQLHRSYLYFRLKNVDKAIGVLLTAIEKLPQESALYEYLAEMYSKEDRYDEAIQILKKGLKHSRKKEALNYSLALVYDRAGNYLEGIAAMKDVLQINPNNASALNYIGYTYADREMKGKLEEALSLIMKALLIKPNDGFITDSLGWVYFRKGDLDQAYLYIQKAYDLVPDEPTIAEHLGDIFFTKSDAQRALKYFEESLAIFQKNGEDSKNQKDINRLKGKIEKIQMGL